MKLAAEGMRNRLVHVGLLMLVAALALLVGCDAPASEGAAVVVEDGAPAGVAYTPLATADWEVSTPAAEGWDPDAIARLYRDAARLDTVYGLLIVTHGKLIAEQYFNEGAIDLQSNLQSATKSYTSALVGLAYDRGCFDSLDEPFLDYFPEYAGQITDPRKERITIRHLLQMRAGYPWEESHPDLWAGLMTGDLLSMMVHYPLISDPGADYHYSNVSPHFLGAIVERACGVDLRAFAEEALFAPLGAELGAWWHSEFDDGYPMGDCCMHVTPRDAAKFGLLYLNDGVFEGERVLSADWVEQSLQSYSQAPLDPDLRVGRNFNKIGYGYQWWMIRAGEHVYNLAYGHGGQQIIVLDEYDSVIVLLADPHFLEHNDRAWRDEKANLNLVANFIAALPVR